MLLGSNGVLGLSFVPSYQKMLAYPLESLQTPSSVVTVTGAVKRGSDELLSHSLVTNGTGMSPTQNDINNDAKKVKLEQNQAGKPSRVLHFRGVPVDATEGEIVQLGLPFGRMTNLVLAKKKNQAWLEMCDVNSATSMVNYFAEHPPQIRSRTVYVQFSNYEELKTESSQQQNAPAAVALQAANQIMSQNMEEPKTVLRVIVEHMLYPVTIDVLRQIFSRFGQVLKIVTFNKNNTFQALIQYSDAISAQTAKVSLNGQNIYNGCCTLRIDFSKLPSLNVKYNNDKSRDYTNPNLPTGENALGIEHALTLGAGMSKSEHVKFPNNFEDPSMRNMQQTQARMPLGRSGMDNLKRGGHPGVLAPQLAAPAAMPSFGPQALTHAPITTGGMPLPPEYDPLGSMYFPAGLQVGALQEAQHLPLAAAAAAMPFGYSALQQQAQAIGAAGLRFPASPQTGTVLLVSNMNEEKVTPDALFTLFGVYGDVYRVKIMFNKKDNALVQFADPNQAQIALAHLDKVKVWGKQLKVNHSKHSVVQMPKEGQPDAGLTKDYTTSPLHRFKKPNSKNHHNIFPPSATLHLSNIPPNVTEEQLKEAFAEHGKIVAFKFFQKDRKMALIQMETVEEAVEALIALHNFELGESHHLRVSFTKSTI